MVEKKGNNTVSRREFLKDAGLIVGGTTIGSMAFLGACGGNDPTTATKTVTTTVPSTVTSIVTSTTFKYIDPIDGTEWATMDELKAHFTSAHPYASATNLISLTVNGLFYTLYVEDMETLVFTLREKLGLFGTKLGCDYGQCGACTVLVDGVPMFSCLMLSIECSGKAITTVEGLADGTKLSPLQQRFVDNDAVQCGYCTPGVLLASTALLKTNPKPTADDVRLALSGHLCMCQNMKLVVDAITGGV